MTSKEKINTIIENLSGRGNSKPRKVKTLASTINSLFAKQLEGKEVLSLIKTLESKKYITVKESTVAYQLPKQA